MVKKVLQIIETKRVENMPSDWRKITGRDAAGNEILVDESNLSQPLVTGEYVTGIMRDGVLHVEYRVNGYRGERLS